MSNDPNGYPSQWDGTTTPDSSSSSQPVSNPTPPTPDSSQQWGAPGQRYAAAQPYSPAQSYPPAQPYSPARTYAPGQPAAPAQPVAPAQPAAPAQQYPYGASQPYAQYGAQQAAPQAQPAWNQPAAPAPAGLYTPAPAPKKPHRSPVLGIIAFLAILVLGAGLGFLGYQLGAMVGPILQQYDPDTLSMSYVPPDVQQQIVASAMPGFAVAIAGFVAWIIAIIAIATRRGRGWGVFGLILGIIAPIAGLLCIGLGAYAALGML